MHRSGEKAIEIRLLPSGPLGPWRHARGASRAIKRRWLVSLNAAQGNMMKYLLSTAQCVAALLLPIGTSYAADSAMADPVEHVQEFSAICVKNFPNLDTVARAAISRGWIERTVRPTGEGPPSPGKPRAFAKGDLTIFLMDWPVAPMQVSCNLSGTGKTTATTAELASLVSAHAGLGEAVLKTEKGEQSAAWSIAPSTRIGAGVDKKRKTFGLGISAPRSTLQDSGGNGESKYRRRYPGR